MSNLNVKPIDLLNNTSVVYDQTKTSYIGRITQKTLSGKTVVGSPIVKYRNTITGPELSTPAEVVITDNNRLFTIQLEASGLALICLYDLQLSNGDITYVGRVNIQLPEPPSTTYAYRGFRIVDDGVSNWKIFILTTANVTAHAGLYMVNNVALTDFVTVPVTIPTATAPSQKAVYKLDDSPFTLTNGTGISLDKANTRIYVHRGVSATHSFLRFNYNATIVTVGALGATTNLFEYETGNLPPLAGTLLLTNSEEFCVPSSGPNAGQDCVIFHTTTTMYRGRLSDLTIGATSWPSLELANNLGSINELVAQTTARATFAQSLQKVVLLTASSSQAPSILVKDFVNDQSDLYCTISANDNNEAIVREMHKFKLPLAPIGFDSRLGYLTMISGTTGVRGIYTACFDSDDVFNLTHIISPVLDIGNNIVARFTAGFVRPDLASPIKVYYRTSGFGSASGGWIAIPDDLDFGNISSPTGQIQIKIGFKVFSNESTNGIQLYSAGLVCFDRNAISQNWEYSHDDSSPGNPSRVAFRLKKAYPTAVPNLFFRARDLSDNIYVQSQTSVDSSLFEYSTNDGVSWLPLGTIPNTVGTLLRYTFALPPGVDVRPSLGEL